MTAESAADALVSCTIDEVRDSWSRVASVWSAFARKNDVHRKYIHGPALLKPCGDVAGLRVLDLGCGEGWFSRELAGAGADVTAIDVSERMIREAMDHPLQRELPVDYRVMDAIDVHRHWTARFDLVTACMALHCMPDPAAVLRAVRAVLAPGGRLVFSIPHPATHARGGRHGVRRLDNELYVLAGGYFHSGPYRVRWRIGDQEWATPRWSRTHSEYVGMLKAAGFVITDELEPRADSADVVAHDRLRNADQVPYYLVVVAEPSHRPPPRD